MKAVGERQDRVKGIRYVTCHMSRVTDRPTPVPGGLMGLHSVIPLVVFWDKSNICLVQPTSDNSQCVSRDSDLLYICIF